MNNKKQKGITLIELVIAISIISIALLGVLGAFSVSVRNSADPVTRKQTVLIAESLMDEVLSRSFVKPSGGFAGPFTNANRTSFDTVTDYNNLVINGISNIYGNSIVGLENYTATITTSSSALGAIGSSDSTLVSISIAGPNDQFVLRGYRINYEN
ncbi:prepilin-type N-terminal cleavage/methylation domain-containing protein [archaeon]|nr:prepilin-type N-terminal cleavage/methylation domain-containing protein [archaeon]